MVDALHHIIDHRQTIQDLWRVLAPGGILIIEEPDIRLFGVKLLALAEKLALFRSHFLSSSTIAGLLRDAGAEPDIHPDPAKCACQRQKTIVILSHLNIYIEFGCGVLSWKDVQSEDGTPE